ncbi:MAG: DUF2202 domain-containing protein [Desulfocapsaceae bacterium]|nr:DUF2202 domain-containing protein [Desulfocapsaceae bacterium]
MPVKHRHLKFTREGKKLARDVYLTLGTLYPEVAVFSNIAVSEQQHTDIMVKELDKDNVGDPNTDKTTKAFFKVPIYWIRSDLI